VSLCGFTQSGLDSVHLPRTTRTVTHTLGRTLLRSAFQPYRGAQLAPLAAGTTSRATSAPCRRSGPIAVELLRIRALALDGPSYHRTTRASEGAATHVRAACPKSPRATRSNCRGAMTSAWALLKSGCLASACQGMATMVVATAHTEVGLQSGHLPARAQWPRPR
jgi:hypothetical protein